MRGGLANPNPNPNPNPNQASALPRCGLSDAVEAFVAAELAQAGVQLVGGMSSLSVRLVCPAP